MKKQQQKAKAATARLPDSGNLGAAARRRGRHSARRGQRRRSSRGGAGLLPPVSPPARCAAAAATRHGRLSDYLITPTHAQMIMSLFPSSTAASSLAFPRKKHSSGSGAPFMSSSPRDSVRTCGAWCRERASERQQGRSEWLLGRVEWLLPTGWLGGVVVLRTTTSRAAFADGDSVTRPGTELVSMRAAMFCGTAGGAGDFFVAQRKREMKCEGAVEQVHALHSSERRDNARVQPGARQKQHAPPCCPAEYTSAGGLRRRWRTRVRCSCRRGRIYTYGQDRAARG